MQTSNYFKGNFTDKFSSEVLQKLTLPRKAIAFDLGVPYSTYDNWVRGEASFPPDLIPRLYQITQDDRLLEFILEPLGRISIPRFNGTCAKSIEKLELSLCIFEGRTLEAVERALEDSKVTVDEYNEIHRVINKVRRVAAELDVSLLQKVGEK